MSFHVARMYKDAAQLKIYKRTGMFPQITRSTGLRSLEEILKDDSVFPATNEELIHDQRWKLFDLDRNQRARTSEFLLMLPKWTYNSLSHVMDTLSSVVGNKLD